MLLRLALLVSFSAGVVGCRSEAPPSTDTKVQVQAQAQAPITEIIISGRVQIDGTPAEGMKVMANGAASSRPYAQTHSDAEGRFSLDVSSPREVKVSVQPEGARPVSSVSFWAEGPVAVTASRRGERWEWAVEGATPRPLDEARQRSEAIDAELMSAFGAGLWRDPSEARPPGMGEAIEGHWRAILSLAPSDLRTLTALVLVGPFVHELGAEPFLELLEQVSPADPLWVPLSDTVPALGGLWKTPEGQAYLGRMAEEQHDPSLVGAVYFVQLKQAQEVEDTKTVRSLISELSSDRFSGVIWPFFAQRFDPDRPVRIGATIPAFSYDDLDGGTIDDASLRGRPYLLEFWATWCEGCQELMPELHRFYAEVNGVEPPDDLMTSGPLEDPWLTIVSVSIDESKDTVTKFRSEDWPMPWTVGWAEHEEIKERFGLVGTPTLILVSATGEIVAVGRLESMSAEIERLRSLAKPH